MNISSAVYFDLLGQLNLRLGQATASLTSSERTLAEYPSSDDRGSVDSAAKKIAPAATIYPEVRATTDIYEDVETAVITNRIGLTDYTFTTYMKDQDSGTPFIPRIHFAQTADFSTFTGGQFSLPPSAPAFDRSVDPFLAENPYTTGDNPKRIYNVGIAYRVDPNTGRIEDNALCVWTSDNGGQNWSSPAVLELEGNPNFLDKPTIDVSWHAGTLGDVYVVVNNTDSIDNGSLQVYRNSDGLNWVRTFVGFYGPNTSPLITVDSDSGDIYLLWINAQTKQLRIARSPAVDQGNAFTELSALATRPFLVGVGLAVNACNTAETHCLRAKTVLMARADYVNDQISVVWHEREGGPGTNTDVYFARFSIPFNSWSNPERVNDVVTNDQLMPALDFDEAGQYMVTFYDRRNPNSGDTLYEQYVGKVNWLGQQIEANTRVSSFQSDPRLYAPQSGIGFIGDYQDIWYWMGTWKNSWVGIPSANNGNIYLSRIGN